MATAVSLQTQRTNNLEAASRSVIESLEKRAYLSLDVKISFAPTGTWADPGYIVDAGKTYRSQNGYTYGWERDSRDEVRDRNSGASPQQRRDTLIHFGGSSAASKWEFSVPNGQYFVRAVSGDPSYVDSRHHIRVEGQTIIEGSPSWSNRWIDGNLTVNVSDGKLTVTPGERGWNHKLNFIEIRRIGGSDGPSNPQHPYPPAAPSSISASSQNNGSSIRISWRDNSIREQGYHVEHSTNGNNWSRIATTGASATSFTLNNPRQNSNHFVRVRAFNEFGTTGWYYGNTVWIGNTSGNNNSGNNGNNSGNNSGNNPSTNSFTDGVTIQGNYNPYAVIPVLRDLGIKSVRIWAPIEWHRQSNKQAFDVAKIYHNAGIKVTMLLQDADVPAPWQVTSYFNDFIRKDRALLDAVDRWEIINEPNLWQYFHGSLNDYVQRVLKPSYEALNAMGEKVVGAGLSERIDDARRLRDAGYLNYVHYANFHPYGGDVWTHMQRIRDVKEIFAGKPLVLTEWNMHIRSGDSDWVNALNQVRDWVKQNVETAYYFNFAIENTSAGPASLVNFTDSGSNQTNFYRNEPFYNMYQSWN